MKIHFSPINLIKWNLFDCVVGSEDYFTGTNDMCIGDRMVFYVSGSGIFATGTILSESAMHVLPRTDPVYGRETVLVRIDRISYDEPLCSFDDCKRHLVQVQSTHEIQDTAWLKSIL